MSAAGQSKPDEHSGVIPLDKTHKHKRNPKRQKRTNFVRGQLTKEDKKSIKFATVEPIYAMWCDYFTDLVGPAEKQLDDRMLKADYHGAMLMVAEASNPTMIGLTGIVLMETRYTFQLVTREDKYIVIPKRGSVFQFVLSSRVFSIFGDAMRYRPCLRGKKQRLRGALPLFLR